MPRRFVRIAVIALVGAACATERRSEQADDGRIASLRALGALGARAETPRVALDVAHTADAPVRLVDPSGAVAIAFALRGARAVPATMRDGVSLFAGAFDGADVAHVPRADGVEDFVFFDAQPAREEIAYDVDVSRVAGLRLVGGALEMLDAEGTPRLRVARPYVVGADGARRDAALAVEGCAVDTNAAAPWGRAVIAPGARACRVRVAWSGVRYPAVVDPSWTSTGSLSGSRYGHAMVTLASGKLLVVDGFHRPAGMGTGLAADGELFDPMTRTWASAGTLPNGRQDLALAKLPSGKYLVIGGGGSSRPELYDPMASFSRSNAMVAQPSGLTATSLASGLVLVAGGSTGSPVATASLYIEASDSFSAAGSLGTARAYHSATTLASGKILFVGGSGPSGPLASAELYDPIANTFAPTGAMAHARTSHVAVLLADGRVFVTGGGDASAEIYDPATTTFSPAGAMAADRASAQGVRLQSGHVLVAGGNGASGTLATVETFDPATRTFTPAAPLAFKRMLFTAAVLATGEAIVVGGAAAPNGLSLDSTEVWKPGAAGTACVANDDCLSGACEEGVCCAASSCTGACKTCVTGTGACVAVTSKDDLDSCTGASTCDAMGACKKKNGQSCAATTDCASGFCVDGVCCDKACSGQCEACDVAAKPGTCSAVLGDSHGARARCTAFGASCGGACNGIGTTECAFPSAVTSCGSSCADAMLVASTCDGRGACIADVARPCAGNYACADAASCKTTCAADADCAKDFHCDATKCVPSAVCNDHVITKNGASIDCAPYTCEQSGACKTKCSVVTDCVAPNVCSADGACVAAAPAANTSGCAASPARTDASAWWIALAYAAMRLRRKGSR